MKKALISTLAVGVITTGILGGVGVHAQTVTPTPQQGNFFSSLVDKIASTFGLDRAKVQTTVDQWHSENKGNMRKNMQNRVDNRLTQAVKDGKITEAQKTAIEAKLTEERAKFTPDSFKNMTPDQRRQAFQKEQDDLISWAKTQGIDPTYVTLFGIAGRHGGFMHKMQ